MVSWSSFYAASCSIINYFFHNIKRFLGVIYERERQTAAADQQIAMRVLESGRNDLKFV